MFVTAMQLNREGDAAMAKAFGNAESKKDTKNCNRTRNVHSIGNHPQTFSLFRVYDTVCSIYF